jgi:hypothetical protein
MSLLLVPGALDDSPAEDDRMASSGKPKTTMAKLKREATLRERRVEKAARKRIRKQAQLDPQPLDQLDPEALDIDDSEAVDIDDPEAVDVDPDLSAPEPQIGAGL